MQEKCIHNIDLPLYEDWLDAICTDRQPLVNGQAGRIAMSIILHAYETEQQKNRVKFGLTKTCGNRLFKFNIVLS
jgi:hypothetical protein